LAQNAQPDEVVAAKEVGLVGYYAGIKVIDILGLVSPEAIPFVRDRQYAEAIETFQPDYLFIGDAPWDVVSQPILQQPEFERMYAPVLSEVVGGTNGYNYTLYRRLP